MRCLARTAGALIVLCAPGMLAGCGRASGAPDRPVGTAVTANPDLFEDRAAAAGIRYELGGRTKSPLNVLEEMGTGCATLDYDGDGDLDVFIVGQEGVGPTGLSALFRNAGDGTFTDVTAGSGLETPGYYMGCAVGDLDNDGQPDILVTGYGVNRLYRNLGGGKFKDVTAGSGLASPTRTSWQTSAGFADIDRDGRLDVYIGRYVVFDETAQQFCDYGGVKASCGPKFYDPQFGSLYRNVGGFRFADITRQWGLTDQTGKCLGVVFGDPNDDGWPDLYIGNDEMAADFYVNQKGKQFKNEALPANVALTDDGQVQGAMGVDFGDYNRDGRLDLWVTTFEAEPSSLYLNSGGMFEHRSLAAGLETPTRPYVGFGTKFVDLDNNGWLDLPVANGHIHDNQHLVDKLTSYRQPIQLFMNREGERFEDRSKDAGPGFTTPAVGRGLAVGDLDADGRQDLVVVDLEGPVRVLMNRTPDSGNWLRVALTGTRSNRQGLGARVRVVAGDQTWIAEATTGGSYLSASDPRVHFGLGAASTVDRVEVSWPSGLKSVVTRPAIPGELRITEPR